jgi:hypothetical protein
MTKKIKNTQVGSLGAYVGAASTFGERKHLVFAGGGITEIDEKELADACKDPVVKSWFDDYLLIDLTTAPEAKPEGKPVAAETKGADLTTAPEAKPEGKPVAAETKGAKLTTAPEAKPEGKPVAAETKGAK